MAGFLAGFLLAWGVQLLQLPAIPPFRWAEFPLLTGLAAALLARTRAGRLLWPTAGGVWLALAAVACTPAVAAPIARLLRADTPGPADAVAVLSAYVLDDGTPDRRMQTRLDRAYSLLDQGAAPRLVLTRLAARPISYVPAVRRQLAGRGLAAEVVETGPIRNTREEAMELARLARVRGWRRVLLVTDALHMRRAAHLCRAQGLEVIRCPSNPPEYNPRDLHSPRERLSAWRDLVYETYYTGLAAARRWR